MAEHASPSSGPAGAAGAAAFGELERAVRLLGEELAYFRRRALDAERRARELAAHNAALPQEPAVLRARVDTLEAENADLRARVAQAVDRTRALAERVRFVRQQQQLADEEPHER